LEGTKSLQHTNAHYASSSYDFILNCNGNCVTATLESTAKKSTVK